MMSSRSRDLLYLERRWLAIDPDMILVDLFKFRLWKWKLKRRAEDLWMHPRDHHPNEEVHRLFAEEIARFVRDESYDWREGAGN